MSLWEKQKKWQQIAEKLRKELKDKGEEYKKLSANHEKLRAVVSCMEREKWYLRSKLRSESGNVATGLVESNNALQYKIVENLQNECQTLRDRVKELTDRLESEDSRQLLQQLEHQRRRIAALEAVTEVCSLFLLYAYLLSGRLKVAFFDGKHSTSGYFQSTEEIFKLE